MNKKKWLNSKIIFTITMVFVVCCFILTSLWAAKKIDFHSASQPPIADFSASKTKTDYSNMSEAEYCPSWGENYYLHIKRVVVADLDNSSGQDEDGDHGGYGDYTDLTAHLIQGKTCSVSLENNYGWKPLYWKIWIDYNGDKDFEDEYEEVLSDGFGGFIVEGSFSVPSCAISGDTRMRVSTGSSVVNPIPFCGFIGNGEVEDYTVNITSSVGYNDEFCSTSTSAYRRAQPVIMPEDGTITRVTMYHEASTTGSDKMILSVYDGWGSPQNRIAITDETLVSTSPGWQTIELVSPVVVQCGTPIWLAWVYENNPGIRYTDGSPGRFQSSETWSGGMPDPFGQGTKAKYIYSIYANYTPGGGEPTYKYLGNTRVFGMTSLSSDVQAMHVTMPENGTIRSLTMYHNSGGSGYMCLGVYEDNASTPGDLLSGGETLIYNTECWQTIKLESPEPVLEGSKIWLAWGYTSNPGIRKTGGSAGSYQSNFHTGCPMPDPFDSGTLKNDIYMIYATYTVD